MQRSSDSCTKSGSIGCPHQATTSHGGAGMDCPYGGISRPGHDRLIAFWTDHSIDAAFGGKRALLHQSLQRYEEQGILRMTAALNRPVPIREAIAGFVDDLIERIVSGSGRTGCLIGNCAAELARQDRATAARVRRSLERIEAAFGGGLARAQARGEIAESADTGAMARFLVASIQGLRLVGKAHPDRAALEDIKLVMLRCLG